MEKIKILAKKGSSLAVAKPELIKEWDFKKNNDLGLDINKISYGVRTKVWWICPKEECRSSYDMSLNNRTSNNRGCPYCSGQRVNHTNCLTATHPNLASEWHPTRNRDLMASDVTCGKRQKVWWICQYGHEWEAAIYSRSYGHNCPYCSNQRILKGYNDMWTTNPDLAKQLLNPDDGRLYMQQSNIKLNWKCLNCATMIKNKAPSNIYRAGLSCPKCGDGISYGEKVIYNILNQLQAEFNKEVVFDWAKDKRYDFYLPLQKAIIEVHGMQHYKERTGKFKRTLTEEQENDRLKEQLAKENGIEHYIIIDCRFSELEWIKNDILNNKNIQILNLVAVEWEECHKHAHKSLVMEVCDYYNKNNEPSTTSIAKIFKVDKTTIIKYLKQGRINKWCNYDPQQARHRGLEIGRKNRSKIVCQINLDGYLIKEWKSKNEAFIDTGVSIASISSACRGVNKTAGGFKWMYKEDYEQIIESK